MFQFRMWCCITTAIETQQVYCGNFSVSIWRMSTGEDSSFDDVSYEYDNSDDFSSDEFVDEGDVICEESAVAMVELPVPFLQLNASEHRLPGETERTEDHNTTSIHSLIDESSTIDGALLLKSSTACSSANSVTLNAVAVEGQSALLSHFDTRRASAQESFSIGGRSSYVMSSPESRTGSSAFADYDIISVGGSVKRLCKRCTFVGSENDCFCRSCGLAWIANPCLDLDALIAAQMQFKEEERFHDMIQQEEIMREKLCDQPASVQAQMLTNDILRFVEGFSVGSENDGLSVRTFTEHQVSMLAMEFIVDFINRQNSKNTFLSEIRLYYHVSPSQKLATIRRGDGFLYSTTLRDNLEAEYQAAKMSRRWSQEADFSDENASYFGWIVAISHHEHVKWTTLDDDTGMFDDDRWKIAKSTDDKSVFYTYKGQAVLPLAYFDVSQHRNGADRIFNGLSQVCSDFFGHLRRIEPLLDCNIPHDGLMQRVEL
jgi:hypothetical protein